LIGNSLSPLGLVRGYWNVQWRRPGALRWDG
jgi:hypothetical protein